MFKEISDRLYSSYVRQPAKRTENARRQDSSVFSYAGMKQDMAFVAKELKIPYKDSSINIDEWTDFSGKNAAMVMQKKQVNDKTMPQLKGMGLKDVVYLCENMGLKINVKGRGKVATQSVMPGQVIAKGQLINIELN